MARGLVDFSLDTFITIKKTIDSADIISSFSISNHKDYPSAAFKEHGITKHQQQ
jgi:hypothetical protein